MSTATASTPAAPTAAAAPEQDRNPSMSGSSTLTRVDSQSAPISKYPPSTTKPLESYTLPRRPWRRYITPFERILHHKYPGEGTVESPYIVDWLPHDPEDPQRWSGSYKWFLIAVAAISTLCVALSSSAYSGGIEYMERDFGASAELLVGGISLYVMGFAFGPIVWAPLSEVYGRRIIYIISYTAMTLWTGVTIASPNVASLLVFRFFTGLFGSSPLSNAGGSISDVLDANQRGLGMAVFAAAPFLGPTLGPITGGFLGLAYGWKSIFIFLVIFCGVISITLFLFSAETYAPTLLRRRAATLSKATGRVYRFRADAKGALQAAKVVQSSLIRPWKFLVVEPIVLILTIYTAIIYGVLYLNFAAYPIVFELGHGFNTGEGGLAFLGILVGTALSVVASVFFINPQYIKTAKAKGGRAEPEDRLPSSIWGGVLIVIGLAGFAATDGVDVHWIAPIIFGIPFGMGVVVVFLAVLGYLIDSYTIYAASVLAANSVLRSLFGAAFPLFTTYMYDRLGVHWAAALPGFLALACIPFTVVFYKYGKSIRAKCKYAADAERQMAAIMAARNAAATKAAADAEASTEGKNTAAPAPTAPATATATSEKPQTGVEAPVPAQQKQQQQQQPAHALGGAGAEVDEEEEEDHHLWTQYEALADRDEVDLSDDERVRLDELHKRFDYAKAKPSA